MLGSQRSHCHDKTNLNSGVVDNSEGLMRIGKRQQRKVGREEEGSKFEPSGTSCLCLDITRHPCDKTHALFVRQPSAPGNCK